MRISRANTKTLMKTIRDLPTTNGVYQFVSETGSILYIGKAVNLRSRVRSYFQNKLHDRPWVEQMLPKIADVAVIQTENDIESLILEANLIKKHQPKYNSAGKDDKRYAWIHIQTRKPYPKVGKTRDLNLPGRYFGPYPNGRAVNQVLRYLRKLYPYRTCNLTMYPKRKPQSGDNSRLCVYYHIGLCPGPCDNLTTLDQYKMNIHEIVRTLSGKRKSHIRSLEKKMRRYATARNYEKAAEVRDTIQDLRYLSQQIDVQYGDSEEEFYNVQQARLLSGISEVIDRLELPIPSERIPNVRVECYDISAVSGETTYGSMVVSEGPSLRKSQYRMFKVDHQSKTDDPAMMRLVLERRLAYLTKYNKTDMKESLFQKPDIIILDGAQPQLSAVRDIIPADIGYIAISKGKHFKRAGEKQTDEFWMIKNGRYHTCTIQHPFLFQLLRDEAHRRAITHYRRAKRFKQTTSILDDIPGIGPKRKKQLLQSFATINGIAKADYDKINSIINNKTTTKTLMAYLKRKRATKE